MPRRRQQQVTERLVHLLPQRHAHELARREVLRFLLLALGEELPEHRQVLRGALVLVGVRLAGPERVLVELEALLGQRRRTPSRPAGRCRSAAPRSSTARAGGRRDATSFGAAAALPRPTSALETAGVGIVAVSVDVAIPIASVRTAGSRTLLAPGPPRTPVRWESDTELLLGWNPRSNRRMIPATARGIRGRTAPVSPGRICVRAPPGRRDGGDSRDLLPARFLRTDDVSWSSCRGSRRSTARPRTRT